MSDTVRIITLARVPENLLQTWLQHVRDFDTQYPGCHFKVGANAPDMNMDQIIEAMRIDPELSEITTMPLSKGSA